MIKLSVNNFCDTLIHSLSVSKIGGIERVPELLHRYYLLDTSITNTIGAGPDKEIIYEKHGITPKKRK